MSEPAPTRSSVDCQGGTPQSSTSMATIKARRANLAVAAVVAAAVTVGPVEVRPSAARFEVVERSGLIRRVGSSGTDPVFCGSAGRGVTAGGATAGYPGIAGTGGLAGEPLSGPGTGPAAADCAVRSNPAATIATRAWRARNRVILADLPRA